MVRSAGGGGQEGADEVGQGPVRVSMAQGDLMGGRQI